MADYVTIAANKHRLTRYQAMSDPKNRSPVPKAETARQEGAQGRARTKDETVRDGPVDASDPAVVEAAEVADQVHANA